MAKIAMSHGINANIVHSWRKRPRNAAVAATGADALAMLARRDGETLNTLLKRLDRAIGRYYERDKITDEINGP